MPACSRRSFSATSRSSLSPEAEIAARGAIEGLVGEAALWLYGGAGRLAEPLAKTLLARREKRGKEDGTRRGERLGHASLPRPAGPLVWIHAASVGETVAVLPLIDRLTVRGPTVLLTTGTVTSAEVAGRRLPPGAMHQFAPVDLPGAVGRFLDHWRPDLIIFAESELWPTILNAVDARGVPLAVVNARMSERSFRHWRAALPLARTLMRRVALSLPQSLADAERLRALGIGNVVVCGNLKFDVPPPPVNAAALAKVRAEVGERTVLLAASTHPGEEAAVITAHAELARQGVRLLTIVAPRHPERGEALAAEIAAAGLRSGRRSQGAPIGGDTEVYLADTIGEMGLWYSVADIAFLGGSLVAHGGQNPIEPAKLHVPVLHGPHVGNFRDVYAALAAARAVGRVENATTLPGAVKRLIDDPDERRRLSREAFACVERFTGALDRTLAALEPYLAPLGRSRDATPRT